MDIDQKYLLILFLFSTLIMIGCGNSASNAEIEEDLVEYYVRYEVKSSSIYHGGTLDVTLNDDQNKPASFTINRRQDWELVFGPVETGFEATLSIAPAGDSESRLTVETSIHVSKNNSPFALKAHNVSQEAWRGIYIRYKIED